MYELPEPSVGKYKGLRQQVGLVRNHSMPINNQPNASFNKIKTVSSSERNLGAKIFPSNIGRLSLKSVSGKSLISGSSGISSHKEVSKKVRKVTQAYKNIIKDVKTQIYEEAIEFVKT